MSTIKPPEDQPEELSGFTADDQTWFDRLAGRTTATADARTLAEADALRRVVKRSREQQFENDAELKAALGPAETEARLQALMAELRQRGALSAPSWWRRWTLPATGSAIAAALAIAMLVPGLKSDPVYYDEPPTMRGAVPIVKKQAPDPKPVAEGLAQRLKLAGVSAILYQRRDVFFVDVDVPAEALPGAEPALRAEGLTPTAGLVRVEISAR